MAQLAQAAAEAELTPPIVNKSNAERIDEFSSLKKLVIIWYVVIIHNSRVLKHLLLALILTQLGLLLALILPPNILCIPQRIPCCV